MSEWKHRIVLVALLFALILTTVLPVPLLRAQGPEVDRPLPPFDPAALLPPAVPASQTQAVLVYPALADTFLTRGYRDYNFGSLNGLYVGYNTSYHMTTEFGLVRFATPTLPPGATLDSAWVALAAVGGSQTDTTIRAYRMGSDWYEGGATWANAFDQGAEGYGQTAVPAVAAWNYFDVTALAQAWMAGSMPNYGVMLKGPESGSEDEKAFLSREYDPGLGPQLLVYYTPDTTPPLARIDRLEPLTRMDNFTLYWSGSDDRSGILSYDVQYRVGKEGTWQDFMLDTGATSATFGAGGGTTYYFRVRARDRAGNLGSYRDPDGDTFTTFYTYRLAGQVADNTGTPISHASVSIDPAPVRQLGPGPLGRFATWLQAVGLHDLSVSATGYGSLPPSHVEATEDLMNQVWWLPPLSNTVRSGDFESGSLEPDWTVTGVTATVATPGHSGDFAGQVGQMPSFALTDWPSGTASLGLAGAVDSYGTLHTVYATWSQQDEWDIMHRTYPRGGPWSAPEKIGTRPSTGYTFGIDLAIGSDGTLHVVWPADTAIYYVYKRPGQPWASPALVFSGSADVRAVAVAAGAGGAVHVAWGSWDSLAMKHIIYAASKLAEGSFAPPIEIVVDGLALDIATDVDGTVYLLWEREIGQTVVRQISVLLPGGNWSAPEALLPECGSQVGPIVQGVDGTMYMLLENELDPGVPLLYAVHKPGHPWVCQSASIEVGYYPYGGQLYLAVDGSGALHLLWQDSLNDHVYYSRKEAGHNSWSSPTPLGQYPAYSVGAWAGAGDQLHLAVMTGGNSELSHLYLPLADQPADYGLAQAVTVPAEGSGGAVLSFAYRLQGINPLSRGQLEVLVTPQPTAALTVTGIIPAGAPNTGPVAVALSGSGLESGASFLLARTGYSDVAAISPTVVSPEELTGTLELTGVATGTWDVRVVNPGGLAATLASGFTVTGPVSPSLPTARLARVQEVTSTRVLSISVSTYDWQYAWADLSPWAGQTVTVTIQVHQEPGSNPVWAQIDEVALGAAFPNLWVSLLSPTAAQPGRTATYDLLFGNRSTMAADDVMLTLTLPEGVSFVDASVPPSTTSPVLTWPLGQLSNSEEEILVTTTVASSAPLGSTLVATATISGINSEPDQGDNEAVLSTYVGWQVYLPIVCRD